MTVSLMRDQGYGGPELEGAGPADLLVALECDSEPAFEAVLTAAEETLGGKKRASGGTVGRDLKNRAVGGETMLTEIHVLGADSSTDVIVVVSKPPAPEVAAKVVASLEKTGKPAVVQFVGLEAATDAGGKVRRAANLEETARLAVALSNGPKAESRRNDWSFDAIPEQIEALI